MNSEIKYNELPSDHITGVVTMMDLHGRYWRPVMIGNHITMVQTDASGLIEIEDE